MFITPRCYYKLFYSDFLKNGKIDVYTYLCLNIILKSNTVDSRIKVMRMVLVDLAQIGRRV